MIEQNIVILARHRLKALKYYVADHRSEFKYIQNTFHQLTGLTSLRFVENHGLSEQTVHELILLDNLAILIVQESHPEIVHLFSDEVQRLSTYLDMPARELLNLLFKQGQRFNNQEAISVAMHRGLIENIHNETDAYQRLALREKSQNQRLNH